MDEHCWCEEFASENSSCRCGMHDPEGMDGGSDVFVGSTEGLVALLQRIHAVVATDYPTTLAQVESQRNAPPCIALFVSCIICVAFASSTFPFTPRFPSLSSLDLRRSFEDVVSAPSAWFLPRPLSSHDSCGLGIVVPSIYEVKSPSSPKPDGGGWGPDPSLILSRS